MVKVPERRSPLALFTAYVEFAKILLGNVFLINAGSATAIIAFLGAHDRQPASTAPTQVPDPHPLISNSGARAAVVCYAAGAIFAVLAAGFMARQENVNAEMREKTPDKPLGYAWGVTGFLFLVGSALIFGLGCLHAVSVLEFVSKLLPQM